MPGNSRPIIGLLSSSTVEPWAARQWEGVVEAAQDYNVELVSYIGGVLRSARYDEQANVMYELAASSELDGLIVWSTALGWLLSRQEMAEFFSRFGTTPMVSMEMRFPGLPSVLMDDYGGMRAVIDHLIEEHGRRRIAFIRGPSTHEGFEARYRAYLDSLEAHGLALDSRLVSSESTELDGVGATRALLGEVGPTFDAIAGADDLLVLGALPVLAERGLRVPEDVAVAGFDDLPEDLTTVPPLTSAEPPFKAMGRRAVEILVGMIEGRPAPEAETLPVGLIRRRSCGCPGTPEARKAPSSPRNRGPVEGFALSRGAGEAGPDELWACMAAALREGWPELDESKLRGLWDRFASEARGGERGSFLAAFERELDLAADAEADPTRWLRLLSTMQRIALRWIAALPYETRLRAGELWVLGQELAAEAIRKGIARRRVSLADRHAAVRLLSERLGGVHEVGEQMEVVSKHLSQLGIPGCHLSLFVRPEDPTGEARLVLAHGGSGGRVLPPGGLLFPAPELLPRSAAPLERGLSRLALALYFGRARIGFVVFDIASSEDALICEILRWLLSGALKGSEELLAERAEAAEKEALLKELQHRVKNSIGIIASIAGIQSHGAVHPETKEALAALEARISAVGALYEELFDSGGVDHVDLADYLARVVDGAAASIGGVSRLVSVERSLESCAMDLKRAVSLGLIVNELLTDSMKHAFPEGRRGRILVRLAREGGALVLEIGDDGVGFPPGFVPEESEGFGLRIVSLLAKQLDAALSFESGGRGTRTRLRLGEP